LRRLRELFWQESAARTSKHRKLNVSDKNTPIKFKKYTLERVHSSPNIYTIDDFLSESELLYLEHASQQFKFEKSFVDTVDQKSILDANHRTSTFLSLTKSGNAKIASIERKAADLLGVATPSLEPLQLVRYRQGQFFGVHHDLGSLFDDGSVELPPRQPWTRRRLVTIFCYINDLEAEGGCTHFPACGDLRVRPKRGRAVVFCNIFENGMPDPSTIHEGEPVTGDTIKLGLNIWCCEE
jgi:prolyl 4-hydroxylase